MLTKKPAHVRWLKDEAHLLVHRPPNPNPNPGPGGGNPGGGARVPTLVGVGGCDATNFLNFGTIVFGRAPIAGDLLLVFVGMTTFSSNFGAVPTGYSVLATHRTGANDPVRLHRKYPCDGTENGQDFNLSPAGGCKWVWAAFTKVGGAITQNPAVQGDSVASTTDTPPTVTGSGLQCQMYAQNAAGGTYSLVGDASWIFNRGSVGSNQFGFATRLGSGPSPALQWSETGAAVIWGTGQVIVT